MTSDVPALSGTIYIPDTSSLVENPDALDRLLTDGNVVVLLHQVIEELGRLQGSRNKSDGVRAAARTATRKLLTLRSQGHIRHDLDGILRAPDPAKIPRTPQGGVIAWEPAGPTLPPYDTASGDNLIVAGARRVTLLAEAAKPGAFTVNVVSEDNNVLLKCDAMGLHAENLRYGKLELGGLDEVYRGYATLEVDEATLQSFFDSGEAGERRLSLAAVEAVAGARIGGDIVWNTGVVLSCGERTVLTRADLDVGELQDLRYAQYWDRKRHTYGPRPVLGMTPRDPYQCFAMEFLLDPEVQLVVLDGPAGSGKTRMMVAAALYLLLGQPTNVRFANGSSLAHTNRFDNGLFLLRPEHPSSNYELGFLPGDHDQKLSPWLEPLLQHMRSLSALNEHDFVHDLEQREQLHKLSTAMLRGLDIERSVVLVDELQNGDRHLAKTLMSRFCETSKVVLAGCLDPVQIDNPYVDWRSNALTRVKQTYKGFGRYVAQISLVNNYRGPISKKADEL
ncbi:MAG: PhoH family protein [Deltaproteobacteria bacterium]|nr:PhoH family protein [Deltaproteobacteria bacterium]